MRFSVIVPAPPGMTRVPSIEALARTHVEPAEVEVILALGTNPSRQRNLAAHMATGEVLVFLDSDSIPCPDLFERAAEALGAGYSVVGGPSLTPGHDSPFGRAVASIFASPFGGASVRARYTSDGAVRDATENDLILCNLAIRREVFMATDGFNDELYPNEENEFLNRITRQGHCLAYSPGMRVWRNQRRNLTLFVSQVFNYGRGRAEQIFVCPGDLTLDRLAPAVLAVLAAAAPFLRGSARTWTLRILSLYGMACCVAGHHALGLDPAAGEASKSDGATLPPSGELRSGTSPSTKAFSTGSGEEDYGPLGRAALFPVMHLGYGLGLLWGFLLCRAGLRPRREGHVGIRRIKSFGCPWTPLNEKAPGDVEKAPGAGKEEK